LRSAPAAGTDARDLTTKAGPEGAFIEIATKASGSSEGHPRKFSTNSPPSIPPSTTRKPLWQLPLPPQLLHLHDNKLLRIWPRHKRHYYIKPKGVELIFLPKAKVQPSSQRPIPDPLRRSAAGEECPTPQLIKSRYLRRPHNRQFPLPWKGPGEAEKFSICQRGEKLRSRHTPTARRRLRK
jgi:hypothetical protein